jgi:2-polyprenyl-6-hydroxyphenyl methylase/3-demethylubiquinone-9 3-methyltransferase
MKAVKPQPGWPESWRSSFEYDELEIYGSTARPGYTRAYQCRRNVALEMVARAAAPGASVLDVAAAQGNFTLALAEAGYVVTWNDLRAELADYVRLKHERGEVRFAPGNVFELGLGPCFDVVLVTEIIEHVAHPDDFLRKVAGLVRPGGHVVLTTPNGGYFLNRLPRFSRCPDPSQYEAVQFKPNSDGHIFLLHEDECPVLAGAAGLRIIETALFSNPLTCGHVKTGALVQMLPAAWIDGCERASRRVWTPLRRKIHAGMAVLLRKDAVTGGDRAGI